MYNFKEMGCDVWCHLAFVLHQLQLNKQIIKVSRGTVACWYITQVTEYEHEGKSCKQIREIQPLIKKTAFSMKMTISREEQLQSLHGHVL